MWKNIVAVVALLQFVCAQSPKWRYDKPMGTFGASAKLVCASGSTATIRDKNNKVISDNRPKYELTQSQVDITLKITNLGIDDCGEYHCIVGDKSATLVLGLTVQIEEPKSEYDLANGDKGTVPIVVKGCSFSEITWQKKDTSGSFKSLIVLDNGVSSGPRHDSGRMSINPANGNLIINNVQSSDAGSYQIVHSDGSNELTKQTTVNTGDKPIMEKKPVASYDVTEGEPLTLPCTFKAAVTSSSWEHTKDDGTTKNKITSSSGRVKVSGTNLEIGSAQISDKGSYTCSGTNKFGTSTTTTKINEVIVVPRITSNPVDVSQGKGGTVVLNCTAIGTPVPNVGWTKNGKPLGDQKLGKNIYTINPLKSVDGGEYTCLAHNGAVVKGKKKNDTRTINIIVFSKPTINKETTAGPLKMVLKEKKTIICKADGLPLPSIVFKKDNKVLTGAKNVASTSQSITKSLDYMPSSQSDFGTIVCTASNQQGNASKEIVIQAIIAAVAPVISTFCLGDRFGISIKGKTSDFKSVTLRDPSCIAVPNATHITLSTQFSECGSNKNETHDHIIVSNQAIIKKADNGVITRGVEIIPFACHYSRTGLQTSMRMDVPKINSVLKAREDGFGNFTLNFQMADDDKLDKFHSSFPVAAKLNDRLYFHVSMAGKNTDIALLIDHCFATPSASRKDKTKYNLIVNRCPVDKTLEFHSGDLHHRSFSFLAFNFLKHLKSIYLHCEVFLCQLSSKDSRCRSSCGVNKIPVQRKKRTIEKRAIADGISNIYFIDNGPIIAKNVPIRKGSSSSKASSTNVPVTTLAMGIAVGFLGLILITIVIVKMIKVVKAKRSSRQHDLSQQHDDPDESMEMHKLTCDV